MARRRRDSSIHRPVVWVMGGSRGIGSEIAKQFATIGCEVCVSGRNAKHLRTVVNEITDLGGRAYHFPADVTKLSSILAAHNRIEKTLCPVNVLVNCAGVTVFKEFMETTFDDIRAIIGTNLVGHIHCIKTVLPGMVKRRSGWIFNIISNAATKTFRASSAYTATKAGMLGFGRVLREEMREYNVKIINVIPGATATEMWSRAQRKRHGNRMMSAKSVAEAVLAAYQMPDDVVVDEMLIRPIRGDISS